MTDDDRLYNEPIHGRTRQDAGVPAGVPIAWPFVIGNRPDRRVRAARGFLSEAVRFQQAGDRTVQLAGVPETAAALATLAALLDGWSSRRGVPAGWPEAVSEALTALTAAMPAFDDLAAHRRVQYAQVEVQAADEFLRLWIERAAET